MTRPVSARHPSTSLGRYRIPLSAKRTVSASSSKPTGARSASGPRLIGDQMPSVGLIQGQPVVFDGEFGDPGHPVGCVRCLR